jgi:hypothetical protein
MLYTFKRVSYPVFISIKIAWNKLKKDSRSDLNFGIEGQVKSITRITATTRQFSFVPDEPPTLGRDDLGANPVEYLLASYAG